MDEVNRIEAERKAFEEEQEEKRRKDKEIDEYWDAENARLYDRAKADNEELEKLLASLELDETMEMGETLLEKLQKMPLDVDKLERLKTVRDLLSVADRLQKKKHDIDMENAALDAAATSSLSSGSENQEIEDFLDRVESMNNGKKPAKGKLEMSSGIPSSVSYTMLLAFFLFCVFIVRKLSQSSSKRGQEKRSSKTKTKKNKKASGSSRRR